MAAQIRRSSQRRANHGGFQPTPGALRKSGLPPVGAAQAATA
ncbi:hypothetical protein LC55x_5722 [Lysobacter capsici]|nr:hypothetical protein LC55x_5722 [Lysobacter capsici]